MWVMGIVAVCLVALWLHSSRQMRQQLQQMRTDREALVEMIDCDDLTSARSRRHMRTVFEQETQNGQNTLLFVDMDNFKSVNDGYGHKAGDALLRQIADALVFVHRDGEVVFRIGGDEFGVYLRDTDLDTARLRAEEYRDVIEGTFILVDGVQVRRTASIGVARIESQQDFIGALYYADEAQYAAKAAGGNQVRANAGETLRSMIARRTGPRAEDLERAISGDEVKYHVQPIFDTRADRAIGVEALIRWQRPDGRIMMPHQFIDVIMGGSSREVRPSQAMAQHVATAFTSSDQDIFCSFNVSSVFLDTPEENHALLVDGLLSGLNANRIVLEIVEHAEIRDLEITRALLRRFRAEGVRVALDDFGTGLSNLERLQDLDVDIVKIDRRFIRGVDHGATDVGILHALRDLCRELEIQLIAEGVETEAELDMLNKIGIWNAQGYYLGHPDSVEAWRSNLGLQAQSREQLAATRW